MTNKKSDGRKKKSQKKNLIYYLMIILLTTNQEIERETLLFPTHYLISVKHYQTRHSTDLSSMAVFETLISIKHIFRIFQFLN